MGRSEGSSTPFSIWKSSMAYKCKIKKGRESVKKRYNQYWGYEKAFMGPDPTIFNFC